MIVSRFASAVMMLLASLSYAHDYRNDTVSIDHPWSRPTPPGTPVGVGYLDITNHGSTNIILTGAKTPRAGRVSIHQSLMSEGMMRMQPVSGGLVIPAGDTVKLKPHGYHLMLEQLSGPLVEGERIPATLLFDGAEDMAVELAVETLDDASAGSMGNMDKSMDHSMH
ncbi:copper chaperone PCu(A)C [Marinobacter sp. chi1]|uniref:Copper chaperone PCu(A)C n=1 Tax=Marinobacter suaedae TaxID=3057675 RepID=A0ABT8W401_9GAMM|nr:copper chaperone PCu(A)C [Marinobacter sp. chi1]MDO3722891.1 copper chaperone PCu(A)C [Marinobacter sp. chi1]